MTKREGVLDGIRRHFVAVSISFASREESEHLGKQTLASSRVLGEDGLVIRQGRPIQSLPHEKILGKISEPGKDCKILALKTTMTMPYISVFLQLDCKYCTDEGEQKIRQAMKSSPPN